MASPAPAIIVGGREQLVHLLAEASEVEHTLMCTYLYAAFSLKRGKVDGLSTVEAEAVARWRKAILSVALDEMVHLLLVANLSIASGGRPHFGRPNFPVSPGTFPSEVVVRLAPFSPATLDHFIFLERPKGSSIADGEGFEPDVTYQREEAFHGVMPSIQDYTTIGHLYEAIRTNLTGISARIGEKKLFIGPTSSQVGPDAMKLEGVTLITDLSTACGAIDTIIEQGEGSPMDREDSHYQRFIAIRDEYRALVKSNASFEPAQPAAENPVMRRPPRPDDKVFIDAVPAARVLDLGNAIYALLLQLIVQSFARTGADMAASQARHLSAAITLMHALAETASELTRLPASDDRPGVHAGLTFTMNRSVEPLFFGAVERALIIERFEDLIDAASAAGRRVPAIAKIARDIEAALAEYQKPG